VSLDPVSRDVRDEHDVLRDEQRADPTLERAWVWAQKNKNNFFVKDELLYHRDQSSTAKCAENVLTDSAQE